MVHKFSVLNLIVAASLSFSAMAQSQFSAVVEQTDATSVKVTVSLASGQENCGIEVNFGDQTVRNRRLEAGQPWVTEHTLASERDTLVKVSGTFVARGVRSVNACAGEAVTKAISPAAFKAAAQASRPVAQVASVPLATPAPTVASAPSPPPPPPPPPSYPQQSLQQQAQVQLGLPATTMPVTLKNGCVVNMLFGPTVKSISLSRQDLSPETCPASRRYTGFVSLGVGWTFAPADRAESYFLGVRHGYVVDGYFVGVRFSQNTDGVVFIGWRDAKGNFVIPKFERPRTGTTLAYSLELMRQTLTDGLNASVRPDEWQFFSPLSGILQQFDANPENELRRYTAVERHTQGFMNPNWVKPQDDPKVFGRGARGG